MYMSDLKLAPLQRQRFIFLLGPRYKGSDKVKLVCRQYGTYHENYLKVMEILRQIYWEAKRAPSINTSLLTNPYRRDFFKRKLGRTKVERQATQKDLDAKTAELKQRVDAEEMGLVDEGKKKEESVRQKRRMHAAKRLQLGFNNRGKDEVEDKVLEDLELKEKAY